MFNIPKYLSILLGSFMLSGCWSIPFPSGDTPEKYTESKKAIRPLIGSHKEEVKTALGDPKWESDRGDKTYYIYEWRSDESDILMFGYLPIPWVFNEYGTEVHCILLEFDRKENRLVSYKTDTESSSYFSEAPHDCRYVFGMHESATRHISNQARIMTKRQNEEDYMKAEQDAARGDPVAMYNLYTYISRDWGDPTEAWNWLCNSADKEYEKAQIEVAYWYRESNWEHVPADRLAWVKKAGIQADDRLSYLWYTLAAKGSVSKLEIRDILFQPRLSDNELSEAEVMVKNWAPGQCQSNLLDRVLN